MFTRRPGLHEGRAAERFFAFRRRTSSTSPANRPADSLTKTRKMPGNTGYMLHPGAGAGRSTNKKGGKDILNFENCDKIIFHGVGKYQIPQIEPETIDVNKIEWIPFNFAKTAKDKSCKGIHFYVDDYQFVRLWNHPDDYISLLSQFAAVCTPDFSQYTDMPVAMQIYNHYRKHWLGAYWQLHGMHVIPTICWSDSSSFEWCFDGEPTNGIVSISSVGTQNNKRSKELFDVGCREAIKRLTPSQILWYGICPEKFDWNVTKIQPFYKEIRGRTNGR